MKPDFRRSPNFNRRPTGVQPDCIVLHADAGKTEAGTIAWCCDPASKVSYHYLVHRDGAVTQLVPVAMRAWHAGASEYQGRTNVNDYSIGVSLANRQDGEAFRPAQLQAAVRLVADLCWEYKVPLARITTHAVVRHAIRETLMARGETELPTVKVDPGPLFSLASFLTDVGAEVTRRRTEGAE